MSIRLDPEGIETSLLFSVVGSFAGKRVLEVGCGSGRLTWRYAEQAQSITGIDPNADSIAEAIANTPIHLQDRVTFCPQGVLDYMPPESTPFEVIILSWSLCCMPAPSMVPALQKIHALQSVAQGCLIDIHPRAIPRPLSVQIDQRDYGIESLVDEVMLMQYQLADQALEQVVDQHLYRLEAVTPFSFNVYFDTAAELIQYLRQNDTGMDRVPYPSVDSALVQRVESHLQLPGDDKHIVLQRPVMIRKYTVVQDS